MTTATFTEPRFVIVNARGEFADDLGAAPIFATEAAAEEAIESLTASGFDLDGYSVRELTTNDLVGDERDAMLAACRAEGREAAEQELAECGSLAVWSDFTNMTPSWDALKAMLLSRFGVELYRGRLDEAVSAYRAGRESVAGDESVEESGVEGVLVSLDNGNSTTLVDDEADASAFITRYGERNAVDAIRAAGGNPEWDTFLNLLRTLAAAHASGEIPTLP